MMGRALLLAGILAGMAAAKTERFGIFAGHNLGRNREPLKFAERDAERVAGVFRELGGMEAANVRILKAPDREAVETAFRDLEARARALPPDVDAVFFLYFSGHGDERNLVFGNQEMSLDDVKARFDGFPAKLRVGLFDACQSGAITRIKGAKVIDPFVHRKGVNGEGNIYITSSSGDENSQEADHLEASFFTHHLTSALRGAADVSGDRKVTLMEAYNYAFNHTVAETGGTRGGTQHPNARFRMDMEGDIVLTDVASSSSGIRFGKKSAGEYLILDGNASVMAEVNKEARTEVMVALEPGSYSVFKKEGGMVRRAALTLKAGETRNLEDVEMSLHRGGEGKVKGWTEKASGEAEADAEPVKRRTYAMGFGLGFSQGFLFEGLLRANPWGYLSMNVGYSYFYTSPLTTHQAKVGLEAFFPLTSRIEMFSAAYYNAARSNDGFQTYEIKYQYACPDWNSPQGQDNLCDFSGMGRKEAYASHKTASLDVGWRFHVYPRLSVNMKARMIFDLEGYQFIGRRSGLQPYIMGIETWF